MTDPPRRDTEASLGTSNIQHPTSNIQVQIVRATRVRGLRGPGDLSGPEGTNWECRIPGHLRRFVDYWLPAASLSEKPVNHRPIQRSSAFLVPKATIGPQSGQLSPEGRSELGCSMLVRSGASPMPNGVRPMFGCWMFGAKKPAEPKVRLTHHASRITSHPSNLPLTISH